MEVLTIIGVIIGIIVLLVVFGLLGVLVKLISFVFETICGSEYSCLGCLFVILLPLLIIVVFASMFGLV